MSGEKTILYVNLRTTSGELHFKQFKPDDLCVQIKEWINFCEKVPSFDGKQQATFSSILTFDVSVVTCAGTFPPRILDLDMIEDCRPLKSIFQETNRILLQLKPRGSSMTRERRNHSMNHQSNPSPEEMEQLLYPRMFIEKMPQDNSCLFHAVG